MPARGAEPFLARLFPVNLSKLIQAAFGVIFTAVALWAATFFVQMHRELKALRGQEAANQRRLAEAEAQQRAIIAEREVCYILTPQILTQVASAPWTLCLRSPQRMQRISPRCGCGCHRDC